SMLRYFGLVSSHAALRGEVVPKPAAAPIQSRPLPAQGEQLSLLVGDDAAKPATRKPWGLAAQARLPSRPANLPALRGRPALDGSGNERRRDCAAARQARSRTPASADTLEGADSPARAPPRPMKPSSQRDIDNSAALARASRVRGRTDPPTI